MHISRDNMQRPHVKVVGSQNFLNPVGPFLTKKVMTHTFPKDSTEVDFAFANPFHIVQAGLAQIIDDLKQAVRISIISKTVVGMENFVKSPSQQRSKVYKSNFLFFAA